MSFPNNESVYISTWTGDGNAKIFNIGFTPRFIEVVNHTDRLTDIKIEGMAAADVLHQVANGTGTLDTGSLIIFTVASGAPGFTVAAAANINAKVMYVLAVK